MLFRSLRRWIELGHFPGVVQSGEGEASSFQIPHDAVTAFLRTSVQRQASGAVRAELVTSPAQPSDEAASVPWSLVAHLLQTESAQRQSWQALAHDHARTLETLHATLACERDEIQRLRDQLSEAREELLDLRTRQARVEQALPLEWNQHTRTTQPLSRAALLALVGEG